MARRRTAGTAVAEVLLWLLFFALLVPVGFTGWAIGHYTAGSKAVTRTVTVAAGAATTTATTPTPTVTTTSAQTTPPATTTAPARTTTTAPNPAAAARGKATFAASGCAACHTFKPAGSSGTVGPNLDTRPAVDAKKAKMTLAAFVRQSIVSPDAYIASGYHKGIMPTTFARTLSTTKIADLVAFIVSGSK
jgi:mono/diheme cytochrome c family protein